MRSQGVRFALAVFPLACVDATIPVVSLPKPVAMTALVSPPVSATVGTSAGPITVQVVDSAGAPLQGVVVTFRISRGSGELLPATDTTKPDGTATTTFTVGTYPTVNEVTAAVTGLQRLTFNVTSLTGAPKSVLINLRSVRFLPFQDSTQISATLRDTFNNVSAANATWLNRDTSLLTVTATPSGNLAIKAKRRPGKTYVLAATGSWLDSIPVAVTDSSTVGAACYIGPAATDLAVGAMVAFDGSTCIHASSAGAEYLLVAHLNTAANNVSQSIDVNADGITTPATTFPLMGQEAPVALPLMPDARFEQRLRTIESLEIGPRVEGARAWRRASEQASLVATVDAQANALPSSATEGKSVSLNVNAAEFCGNPIMRGARVAAVTNGAIVLADTGNPVGGFTDEEYRAFGVALDTLVIPIDTAAFGSPTDIDGNRRVGVFFTRAVNEMTGKGSPSVVLGFYFLRDLLPRHSQFGDCPGSNVGEMFYLIVPDPTGAVNGNVRAKSDIARLSIGTIAHEYQHLVNASRRMYVNDAYRVDEEVWLNEGLSHIAEELLFFKEAGIAPRQNITGGQLPLGTTARTAFDDYMRNNIARFREYQRAPETSSPLAGDDVLSTRGATWSFLRYLVDRVRTSDGDFWRTLVNSRLSGVANLDAALAPSGITTLTALRDWSLAVALDDNAAGVGAPYQQSSWNLASVMPAVGGGLSFSLVPRTLNNGLSIGIGLIGGGSGYMRFGVNQGLDALVRVGPLGGAPLPAGVKLTIVRIK